MRRPLLRSSAFVRAAKRLAKKNRTLLDAIQRTLILLEEDPFDPRLRTHKLSGELAGLWACSVAYDLRIVFEFVKHEGADAVLLVSVGTHDEVY